MDSVLLTSCPFSPEAKCNLPAVFDGIDEYFTCQYLDCPVWIEIFGKKLVKSGT